MADKKKQDGDEKPSRWESIKDHVGEAVQDAREGNWEQVLTYEGNQGQEKAGQPDPAGQTPDGEDQDPSGSASEPPAEGEQPGEDPNKGQQPDGEGEKDDQGNPIVRGVKTVGSHVGEGAADFVTGTGEVVKTAAEGTAEVGEKIVEGLSDVFHHEGKYEHSGDKDGRFGSADETQQGEQNVDSNKNSHDTADNANANKHSHDAHPQEQGPGQDPMSQDATPGGAGQQGQGSEGWVTRDQEEAAHKPAEADQHGDMSEGTHPEQRPDVQEV